MCSVQDIKEMRGGGSQRDGQQPILPALNWLGSGPSDLVKWSRPKHPVMVLGGLRRWSHSAGPPTNPPSKTKQNPELLSRADAEEKQELEGAQRGGGNATKPYTCDRPQKYTEHKLRLRTNGRSAHSKNNGKGMYAWPLPMHACIHTHAQESHSFSAFHTYGKQEVHYPDTGNSPWHPSLCLQMYLSCRYNIWAAIISKAKNL